jgi:hypothetical protein
MEALRDAGGVWPRFTYYFESILHKLEGANEGICRLRYACLVACVALI